jgi:hypothetical protein
MKKLTPEKVLVHVFRKVFNKRHCLNIQYHLEKGTKILCGDKAHLFHQKGAG